MSERIIEYTCRLIAVLLIIGVHEYSHAFVAVKCGDETPKINGRYTLNPFAHTDITGLIMLLVARFGWAKPVPINPYNFKNFRRGYFFTAVAGVIANLIFAFVIFPLYMLSVHFSGAFMAFFLEELFYQLFVINLCFFVFNLIPIFPLDGFRVLEATFKRQGKTLQFLRVYGQYILLGLVLISILASAIPAFKYIDLLGFALSFAVNILGWPITAFWKWVLPI